MRFNSYEDALQFAKQIVGNLVPIEKEIIIFSLEGSSLVGDVYEAENSIKVIIARRRSGYNLLGRRNPDIQFQGIYRVFIEDKEGVTPIEKFLEKYKK